MRAGLRVWTVVFNIFHMFSWCLQLVDFGLSRVVGESGVFVRNSGGTVVYVAPGERGLYLWGRMAATCTCQRARGGPRSHISAHACRASCVPWTMADTTGLEWAAATPLEGASQRTAVPPTHKRTRAHWKNLI